MESDRGIRKDLASTFKKLHPSPHHSVLISRLGKNRKSIGVPMEVQLEGGRQEGQR